MSDQDKKDKATVLALLKNLDKNYLKPYYNPTSLIEDLLNILLPKMGYDIDENGQKFKMPSSFYDICTELYWHDKLNSQLCDNYLLAEYGLKIDLTFEESDKLQIIAHYLVMALTDNLKSLYIESEHIHYLRLLQSYIDKSLVFVLNRLKRLIEIYPCIKNDQSDRQNYNFNLIVNGMSVVEQQIYIFNFLSIIREIPEVEYFINKYNTHNIFLRFFNTVQQDDPDDGKRIYAALECLSLFLRVNRFSATFIKAGGFEKLLNIPKSQTTCVVMSECFNSLTTSPVIFKLICAKGRDTIHQLLFYIIFLINDCKECSALTFFDNTFDYLIILTEFDQLLLLNNISNVTRKYLSEVNDTHDVNERVHKVLNVEKTINTLKHYVKCNFNFNMLKYDENNPELLSAHVSIHFESDDFDAKLEILQRLGLNNFFLHENIDNSTIVKYHRNFIHLLCDIINQFVVYTIPKTTMKKTSSSSGPYDPDIYDQFCIYKSSSRTIHSCLDMIKIYSIDLETIDIITTYKDFILRTQPIEKYHKKILKIINNCLWTPIYIFNSDNVDETTVTRSKTLFNETLKILQIHGDIKIFLHWLRITQNKKYLNLILRALIGLCVDENIKKTIIEYVAEIFTFEYWSVIDTTDNKQTLLRKYGLDFIESVLKYKNIFSKPIDKIKKISNITLQLLSRSYNNNQVMYSDFLYSRYKKTCLINSDIINQHNGRQSNSYDYYTTCCYTPHESTILVGSSKGEVLSIDIDANCARIIFHAFVTIDQIKISYRNNLFIVNPLYDMEFSMLCNYSSDDYSARENMFEDNYIDFNNSYDQIISSSGSTAKIYDLTAGKIVRTLVPSTPSCYVQNKATFDISDRRVLNDGTLWDINSNKEIYRFEQINNNYLNGVFSDNGVQVIFNQCVWDLRNNRIIKIVPELSNMSSISITPIIYAWNPINSRTKNYFEVVDNENYSSIATHKSCDQLTEINSVAIDLYNKELAVVENKTNTQRCVTKSVIQLYEIGMLQPTD